jgi:hypothetical protein
VHTDNILDAAGLSYGQGQSAKLKISQSDNIVPNIYEAALNFC